MKTYIINKSLMFTEQKNEIRNLTNAVVVRMTAMRSRCLSYILENATNEVIERKELSSVLWGERGKYVNDANLTQILYLIRKDLKLLGVNEFFITIPRIGIRVSNDTSIKPVITNCSEKNKQRLSSGLIVVLISVISILMLIAFYFL